MATTLFDSVLSLMVSFDFVLFLMVSDCLLRFLVISVHVYGIGRFLLNSDCNRRKSYKFKAYERRVLMVEWAAPTPHTYMSIVACVCACGAREFLYFLDCDRVL